MILRCIKGQHLNQLEELVLDKYYQCEEVPQGVFRAIKNIKKMYMVYDDGRHLGYFSRELFEDINEKRERIIKDIL